MADRKIAVVVPALDEAGSIEGCLASIAPQAGDAAIVVVDNGSTDDTAARVERFARPGLELHLLREPRPGVAAARRAGMDFATYELGAAILASTDADTFVHPEWLAGIRDAFESATQASYAAGPFVYAPHLARRLRAFARFGEAWRRLTDLLAPMAYLETCGSNFAIRSQAYRAIGGMPLLSVGEDLAVAELLLAQGHTGVALPHANHTSARRAHDLDDFLTGRRRLAAWGSHGRVRFNPHREPEPDRITDLPDETALLARCLRYFALQHVLKPLVIVASMRPVILGPVLNVDRGEFDRAVAESTAAASGPYWLEDVILAVDRRLGAAILDAIRDRLEGPAPGTIRDSAMPFHCRGAP